MWSCSVCQSEHDDSCSYCYNCGAPRPAAKPKKKAKRCRYVGKVVFLSVLILLLVAAIVTVVVNFPRLSEKAAARRAETITQHTQRHTQSEETAAPTESGGESSVVIDVEPTATPAPQETPLPTAEPPAPTPEPTPTPAPTPSPAPTTAAGPNGDYLIPGSDSRYITEADLDVLTHEQVVLARNEIFARHGRIFKSPEIAAYFNGKSWYHGSVAPEDFSYSVFNRYESANIDFIVKYEAEHWGGT